MQNDVGPDHYARGCLLREQKRYDLAASEFRAAMAADPNDARAPAMLSLTLAALRRPSEALAAAKEAIRRDPSDSFAYVPLGYALWASEHVDGATRAGHEALRLNPYEVDAHFLLAQIAEAKDDWPSALHYCDAALSVVPFDARFVVLRASALIALGRVKEALHGLRMILRHAPENGAVHETLGLALLHAGQETQAFSHLKEALRLNPNSDQARTYLAEALKSRSKIYRTFLRAALWFRRRKKLKSGSLIVVVTLYVLALAASASFWQSALPLLAVGFGIGLFVLMLRHLSMALFDLLLQFDPFGRHLLSIRQRVAACIVGAVLGVGSIAIAAAIFLPTLLFFAIPTTTIGPWLAYGLIVEPEKYGRRIRHAWLALTLISAEIGLFLIAITRSFDLSENIFGLVGMLLMPALIELHFVGGWLMGAFLSDEM